MYPKEEINQLKGDLKTNLQLWAESQIDEFCKGKPSMQAASVYMKRGLNNWMEREDHRINSFVDNSLLFLTEKDGSIKMETVIDDAVAMFKAMDVQETDVMGLFHLTYGKGELRLDAPNNVFFNLIFGKKELRITAADLLKLKEYF